MQVFGEAFFPSFYIFQHSGLAVIVSLYLVTIFNFARRSFGIYLYLWRYFILSFS